MTTQSSSRSSLRRVLLLSLTALSGWAVAPAGGLCAAIASVDSGAKPYVSDTGDVTLMMCRRGPLEPTQDMQHMQDMQNIPQDFPLLCLATQISEEDARMSPVQLRELIDQAARSGGLSVIALHPD
jgi:hypothetical protein